MTIAATHRQGCRSGTASMTAGLSGGVRTSTLISEFRLSAGRAVDDWLVDHASLDTPVRGDRLVVAGLDQVLEGLLQRGSQGGTLRDGPAVGRRVEGLAGLLELART